MIQAGEGVEALQQVAAHGLGAGHRQAAVAALVAEVEQLGAQRRRERFGIGGGADAQVAHRLVAGGDGGHDPIDLGPLGGGQLEGAGLIEVVDVLLGVNHRLLVGAEPEALHRLAGHVHAGIDVEEVAAGGVGPQEQLLGTPLIPTPGHRTAVGQARQAGARAEGERQQPPGADVGPQARVVEAQLAAGDLESAQIEAQASARAATGRRARGRPARGRGAAPRGAGASGGGRHQLAQQAKEVVHQGGHVQHLLAVQQPVEIAAVIEVAVAAAKTGHHGATAARRHAEPLQPAGIGTRGRQGLQLQGLLVVHQVDQLLPRPLGQAGEGGEAHRVVGEVAVQVGEAADQSVEIAGQLRVPAERIEAAEGHLAGQMQIPSQTHHISEGELEGHIGDHLAVPGLAERLELPVLDAGGVQGHKPVYRQPHPIQHGAAIEGGGAEACQGQGIALQAVDQITAKGGKLFAQARRVVARRLFLALITTEQIDEQGEVQAAGQHAEPVAVGDRLGREAGEGAAERAERAAEQVGLDPPQGAQRIEGGEGELLGQGGAEAVAGEADRRHAAVGQARQAPGGEVSHDLADIGEVLHDAHPGRVGVVERPLEVVGSLKGDDRVGASRPHAGAEPKAIGGAG